jgi:hypothetical protein
VVAPELAGLIAGVSAVLAAFHLTLSRDDLDAEMRRVTAVHAATLREAWWDWLAGVGVPAEGLLRERAADFCDRFDRLTEDAETDFGLRSVWLGVFDGLCRSVAARRN